jgi:ribose-phosphate pyrophosphokinase
VIIFSTAAYALLASEIGRQRGAGRGEVETRLFADGERYLRLRSPVAGQDVVLVGGTVSEADTLELYDLGCGLVEAGARSLTLIIPYFGYATMERAVRSQEIVTAKTRARLLSSIPVTSISRVVLLDLHTEGIPYYFEGALRAVHLYARPVVLEAVRRMGQSSFAIGCTDAGRAKWVESLANDLGVPAAFVFKRRSEAGTEVTAVSAQVKGRHVIIYDDLIRTGSSLLGAARAFLAAGATGCSAIVTHCVLPGDSLAMLERSGLLDRIVVTDSHPRAALLRSAFLQVDSVAGIFAGYLREAFP